MFYNGSKIRGRSTELVGALFKGPHLKLAIGGAILLAVAVTATLAGIFTNISEAQSQPTDDLIGFDQPVYRVTEGETLTLTVNTSMGGMPNNEAGGLLYIETNIKDGTAKAGTHFPTPTTVYSSSWTILRPRIRSPCRLLTMMSWMALGRRNSSLKL